MNNFFKKFTSKLLTNLKTILQAVIASVIIWFFISIQIFPNITQHISDVKVECKPTQHMINENLQITSVDVSEVTIKIQGKRYSISDLKGEDFVAHCDLSKIYEAGVHDVDIVVETADSATECEILADNLTAKVNVSKIISREIEVAAYTDGIKIADGMQIEGKIEVFPSTIIVTGEEKLVNSIGHIKAVPAYEDVLGESAELVCTPVLYNQYGMRMLNDDLALSEGNISMNVPVYKVRTLPLNVQFTNSSTNFNISNLKYSMSVTELTIASPDSSIDNLDAIDIGEISLTSLTLKDLQGGVALPVKLPDGYKNISGNKTVTVYFENYDEYGQLGFTVPAENINVINAPNNFDVKVLTNVLTVNVVGLSSYIQEMTSDDIYATVNLLGVELSEGTKSVSVSFRLSGTNSRGWVTGEEYKVEIQISLPPEDIDALTPGY